MHRSSLALYLTAGVTNLQQRGQKKSWRGQLQFGFASKWYPNLCPFKSFRGQCVCKPLDHWMLADFLIFEGQTQPVSSLPCWLLESHPIASEHAVLRAAQAVLSLEPPQIGHLFRPTKMATFMVKMCMLICVICVRGYIRYVCVCVYIYICMFLCVCVLLYCRILWSEMYSESTHNSQWNCGSISNFKILNGQSHPHDPPVNLGT